MKMLSACLPALFLLVSIGGPASAADVPFDEVSPSANLPEVRGHVVRAVRYQDKTGENLVILSETDTHVSPGVPPEERREDPNTALPYTKLLQATRFLMKNDGSQPIWHVNDGTEECVANVTADFVPEAVRITDLNDNGIAEIWMDYAVGCIGDISPNAMKLIMYEGTQKYAMRGEEKINAGEPMGGRAKMDAAFREGPAAFRHFAQALWDQYVVRKER